MDRSTSRRHHRRFLVVESMEGDDPGVVGTGVGIPGHPFVRMLLGDGGVELAHLPRHIGSLGDCAHDDRLPDDPASNPPFHAGFNFEPAGRETSPLRDTVRPHGAAGTRRVAPSRRAGRTGLFQRLPLRRLFYARAPQPIPAKVDHVAPAAGVLGALAFRIRFVSFTLRV